MARENYRTNLEYRASVRARILALAKQCLAGELGVIAAARELRTFESEISPVEPEIGATLMTFIAIDSETDALPVGGERRYWNATALEREDRKIEAAENIWRADAHGACVRLVRLMETSPA